MSKHTSVMALTAIGLAVLTGYLIIRSQQSSSSDKTEVDEAANLLLDPGDVVLLLGTPKDNKS
jgi:hypothetical protein